MSSLIPAFIFAAKSTDDPKDSVGTQIKECREGIEAEGERRIVGKPFTDVKKSAFTGNRGPGLASCIGAAVDAAAKSGKAEIWVQFSDRLARGSGEKGEARHLAGLWFEMKEAGVRLRSVNDDHNLEDAIRAVLIGERNHEDSRRKSIGTKAGMRKAAEEGRPQGPACIGFRRDGKGEDARFVVVHEQVPLAFRIFNEFVAGKTQSAIARGIQADGIPTLNGAKRWSQATIAAILRNPTLIGKVKYDGEVYEGMHEAIIPIELWEKAQSLLKHRPANGRGRPPKEDFLLRGLLYCGCCGEKMYPRERIYECVNYECAMGGVSRGKVDSDVVEFFQEDGFDYDATRAALLTARDSRIAEAAEYRQSAEGEVAQRERALARKREQFKADEIDAAEWREFRDELEEERDGAQAEAQRWKSREAEIDEEVSQIDADQELLERLASIHSAAAGEVKDADGIAAVRAALTRLFSAFVLYKEQDWIKPVRRIEGDDPGAIRYDFTSSNPKDWTIEAPKFVRGKTALDLGEKNKTGETCSSSTSPCPTPPASMSCGRSARPTGSAPVSTRGCR